MADPMITMRLETGKGVLSADNARLSAFGHANLTTLNGWYGGVSVTSPSSQRLGFGEFVGEGRGTARVLTLGVSFWTRDEGERRHFRRAWSGAFHDGARARLVVDWDGLELAADVVQDGEVGVTDLDPHGVRILVPLRAADPHLYSTWREVTVFPRMDAGIDYPLLSKDPGAGLGVTFGDGNTSTQPIWNDGNAESSAIFEVTADSPSGFVVGYGGAQVSYPWPTFSNVPITVDMSGAVRVGGVDQSHRVGTRRWGGVNPHSISTPYMRFIGGSGTGWATVKFRDTYI